MSVKEITKALFLFSIMVNSEIKTVAIVGGGASGCFCAIEVKRRYPEYRVLVFESGTKLMQKLSLTGGGRCNLTNTFDGVKHLSEVYPRGDKLLKRLFYRFDNKSIVSWFESEGVRLFAQKDNRVFPQSEDAMQIVRTLEKLMHRYGIEILCGKKVEKIQTLNETYSICFSKEKVIADFVILTIGGTKQNVLKSLLPEGIDINPTVPSLYTFKIPVPELKSLMGTAVQDVQLSIVGTKYTSIGPLLITDWGISGPAVLSLSSRAAIHLASVQYDAFLKINWLNMNEEEARELMQTMTSYKPSCFTDRLWRYLMNRAHITQKIRYAELSGKAKNILINVLTSDIYPIKGRAAFKEEFVTCGGVSLSAINQNTLEAKLYPHLFFAGEVLDIDALTGGFNLQAAWTTAFVAANLGAN